MERPNPNVLLHMLTTPGRTLCGKKGWGLTDREGATREVSMLTCERCMQLLKGEQAA